MLVEEKVIAIGEIGLDRHIYQKTKYENYNVNEEFMNLQKEFFVAQLKLAKKYQKSVIIHNREAKQDLLPLLNENWDSFFEGRMVFHCCEPDGELLDFAIQRGILIGVDGDVTYRTDKQEFVKKAPPEMLVLETDSPFLTPRLPVLEVACPGNQAKPLKFPNKPENLPLIARFVARLKGKHVESIVEATTQNAKKLFNLYQ